jgi:hypothetical protein
MRHPQEATNAVGFLQKESILIGQMSLINHYLLVGKADKNPLTEIFH